MKVLLLNGSPHENGCTATALNEVAKTLNNEGIETEIICVGNKALRGCTACMYCRTNNKCVFNDIVNDIAKKFEESDGLVIGSPVYYASANGNLISLLDRLFYSTSFEKRMKVGASVVSARRGGCSATFDELNKYFAISQMPIATSQYWNMVHGVTADDVKKDEEGLQTMRTLGKNIAFLIKSINLGKQKFDLPEKESPVRTNFIKKD